MKAVYRPIRAKYLGNNTVELWNTRSFADTSDIDIKWQTLADGRVSDEGKADFVIKAGEKKTFTVESKALASKDSDVFINLIYSVRDTGFEVAAEQLEVSSAKINAEALKKCADVVVCGDEIIIGFNDGKAVFHKKKGLTNYIINGKEMLLEKPFDGQHGFVPHIYRGRLDNDQYLMIFWKILGIEEAKARLSSCKVKSTANGSIIRTSYNFVTRGIFVLAKATVDYYFDENGKITVTSKLCKICPVTSELPRFGVHCELVSDLSRVSYYGRGPLESYCDFKEHTTVGVFDTTVEKMAHKYIKPQDSGNRTEVRYAEVTDSKKNGILFRAKEKLINFNINTFTLGQLIKAKHIEDLPDEEVSFVSADGFVRGTGSGSCGPIPPKEHRISFGYTKPLEFTFEINPIK